MSEDLKYDLVQTETGMYKKVLKPEFRGEKRNSPQNDTLKVVQTLGSLLGKVYDSLSTTAKKKFSEEEVAVIKFFSEGKIENKDTLAEIMKK